MGIDNEKKIKLIEDAKKLTPEEQAYIEGYIACLNRVKDLKAS